MENRHEDLWRVIIRHKVLLRQIATDFISVTNVCHLICDGTYIRHKTLDSTFATEIISVTNSLETRLWRRNRFRRKIYLPTKLVACLSVTEFATEILYNRECVLKKCTAHNKLLRYWYSRIIITIIHLMKHQKIIHLMNNKNILVIFGFYANIVPLYEGTKWFHYW